MVDGHASTLRRVEGAKGRALSPGTRIDRYRLGEQIGAGFGVVYAAEDESGARFALKTLRTWDAESSHQNARFAREARVANDIDHPAIVKVLETGTLADGRPYLVMPLLEGRTLQQAIRDDGPLPPARAWRLLRPVTEALARAHARGVVHRDVKPSNVFLVRGEDGEESPRLLDFGLAHAIESAESEELVKLTQSGVLVGTPAYMAPEQWWGLPAAPSVDQYVLGATLFEALTGHPPFTETALRKLMERTLHAPAPSVVESGAAAGEAVDTFVKRLLAKDPADRFPSMEGVLAAGDDAFSMRGGDVAAPGVSAPAVTLPAVRAADLIGSDTRAIEPAEAVTSARPAMWMWHAGVLATGLALLVGVGYAGDARRDVIDWMHIGGFVQFPIVIAFVIGAIALPLAARKRPGEMPRGALAWALAPAFSGMIGVVTNWRAVEGAILRARGLDAFRVFCEGTYEANAARFLGFALSSILCTSLIALPAAAARSALPSPGVVPSISPGAPTAERRARAAALLTLAALAFAASALGAPSGAWIAAMSALCLAGAMRFPLDGTRAEPSRAATTFCAIGLTFAVGVARVEARQAVLWSQPATRAARIAEILDARAELNATWLLGAAALVGAALPIVLALTRVARDGKLPRPARAAWIGVAVLAAAVGLDLVMRDRFLRRREELRAELAPQFATFLHLDPPSAGDLDPGAFAPRRSTGLQIGRDAVAVNGRGIAKLAALDTETGLFHATSALHQALGQAAVDRGADEVDLTVTADEDVPYGKLARLLGLARAGGARRVDLLFRRGPKPVLSTDNPPETSYVVPSDFAAVPVELADDGFTARDEDRWSVVAPALLREVAAGKVIRLRAR